MIGCGPARSSKSGQPPETTGNQEVLPPGPSPNAFPIKGEWAEVRTVAIGEVKKDDAAAGHRQLKTWRHSYFSRMIDATTFEQLAEGEMRRRGVSVAKEVCAVTDGAGWL